MESLIQPEKLRFRILQWANEESQAGHVHANAGRVLEGILYRGELPRAEVPDLLGVGERQARRVVSNLIEIGVITSNSDWTRCNCVFQRFSLIAGCLDCFRKRDSERP